MAVIKNFWIRKFPKTIPSLEQQLRLAPNSGPVWQAFLETTGLADDKARRIVTPGDEGPVIWFRDLGFAFAGEFEHENPRRIIVSSAVAMRYEELSSDSAENLHKANIYLLGKTMHEIVHWTLFDRDITETEEMGVAFEQQAFGGILNPFWVDGPNVANLVDPKTIYHGSPEARGSVKGIVESEVSVGQSRGIRNNNPGNIKLSRDRWQGLASYEEMTDFQRLETVFFVFREAVWGIRAMARILHNYQYKRGLKTVGSMISRWAPPNDSNKTDAYIDFVARRMSISAGTVFNFEEPVRAIPLIKAIIYMENGSQPYSDAQIHRGFELAQVT